MHYFSASDGWRIYQPGQEVRCPNPMTARRDDRRGGPKVSGPSSWSPSSTTPPPDQERRRLVWPPEFGRSDQRLCHAVLMTPERGTFTWVRLCPEDRSGHQHRYLISEPPPGCTVHTKVCPDCGFLLELCSAPAQVLQAAG